jgi:hypothetical protein
VEDVRANEAIQASAPHVTTPPTDNYVLTELEELLATQSRKPTGVSKIIDDGNGDTDASAEEKCEGP